MSDNEEDSHEGSGDGGNRADDDRSVLWDRAIGLLLGGDPAPVREATGDDRPSWERAVDERGPGDERDGDITRAGEHDAGSRNRPGTRPDTGPQRSQRQDNRPQASGQQSGDRGDTPPEQQVTGQGAEQSTPAGQPNRPSETSPGEDDADHVHRAGGTDRSDRRPNRNRQGNKTLSQRHQIGEWVPRGQIHRYTSGPPHRESVSRARPEPRDGGEGYDEPQEVDPDQLVDPDQEEWECRQTPEDSSSEAWEATLRDRRPDRRQHRRWKRQFVTISGPATETEQTEESEGDREQDESDDTSRVRLR